MAKKSHALLHWNNHTKGKLLQSHASGTLRTLSPIFKHYFTLSRAQMGKSTVYSRWGLRHLDFDFVCCMYKIAHEASH